MSEVDLKTRFPQMTPMKGTPPMFRINGCGPALYGRRDYDRETETYVSTLCLALLFIPVLCLRAYRVARAREGWYFIGREPLSVVAKGWNLLLLGGIAAAIAAGVYSSHTSSPEYKAKQQMAAAREMADKGQLAQASKSCLTLMVANNGQRDSALALMKDMLDTRCPQAPLPEVVGVYGTAVEIARGDLGLSKSDLADKGLKLATARGGSDPAGGVALLDVIRPLVLDSRPIDAQRLPLLRRWAAADPGNLAAVVPLASLLEEQDQADEAKKLLLPLRDKLGDGEGARVLGTILGREGDHDGAYALLRPYVMNRLDVLHAAEQAWSETLDRLWEREVDLLKKDKGPADFYKKYDAASKEGQQALVREHVNARIKDDPQYATAQEAMRNAAAVVPVALELGIVMLQRAQAVGDPAVRKSQLEAAEEVFLAIGGVAGETDQYRLSLGQVYYWLGKQKEGRQLFDEFLATKGRKNDSLLQIASRLRLVGARTDSRIMSEEAYQAATTAQERYDAAHLRSVCFTDIDDKLAWLDKCDPADLVIKSSRAKTAGDKAVTEGRDDEAVRQYRLAVDACRAMARSSTSLNEEALAHSAIYRATGDRASLDRCLDCFQQAVALEPSDSILLYNAGGTLMAGALADVIGSEIDLAALRESGGTDLLRYLYSDQPSRDALVRRVKEHPGVVRAISYLDKVTVLAPKDPKAFAELYVVHQFTQNEPALRDLETRLRTANLDASDALADLKEHISGVNDAKHVAHAKAILQRSEAQLPKLRAKGGRTASVAIAQHAGALSSADLLTRSADANQVVALAEEADRLAPSAGTLDARLMAHLFRAGKSLRAADAAFDVHCRKYERALGVTYVLILACGEAGPFRQRVIVHPDVQKAAEIMREQARRFPQGRTAWEWAFLKHISTSDAEQAATVIRGVPRRQTEQAINNLLYPYNAGEAFDELWLHQILAKPGDGRDGLRRIAAAGIPLPVAP